MKDVSWRAFAEAVRGLNVDRALIDGEAVVLRKDGRSDFGALLTKRGGAQATLIAFDLVRLYGNDQRLRPLEVRREALQRLVPHVGTARRRAEFCLAKRRSRGRGRVRQGLRAWLEKPQLVEDDKPGFR